MCLWYYITIRRILAENFNFGETVSNCFTFDCSVYGFTDDDMVVRKSNYDFGDLIRNNYFVVNC